MSSATMGASRDTVAVTQAGDEHRPRSGFGVSMPVCFADPVGRRDVFGDERLVEESGVALASDRRGGGLDVRLG